MDRQDVIAELAGLTGGLRPSRGSTPDDLREVRRLLAAGLSGGGPSADQDAVTPSIVRGRRLGVGVSRVEVFGLDEAVVSELTSAADLAAPGGGGVRVSRRTVPFLTSTEGGSLPAWAAGQRVERTFGPFLDADGRPVWFDIFIRVRQVSIVRSPSAEPFLRVLLRGFAIAGSTNYAIPAGSVWIAARALTPAAPAGGYVGMRVKGGRLSLTSAATVGGNTLTIGSGVRATLELELDLGPAAAAPGPGGEDGTAARVELPRRVTFEFTAAGGAVTHADNAAFKAIGGASRLALAHTPATFEPLLNRVLVPFTTDAATFPAASGSGLIRLSGEAPIQGAGWALAVAVVPPANLGEASGAGGLAVRLAGGVRIGWRGLSGPDVALGAAVVLAESGRVMVAAPAARGPGGRQTLRLWDESDGKSSLVRLAYHPPALLRYISQAGVSDALVTTAALEAAVDRPVRADGLRLPLRSASAAVGFIRAASGDQVLIQAPLDGAAGAPVAMAVSNGLFTVSPAQVFTLGGTTADGATVTNGTLTVLFRALGLTLTLRDPYVTNQPLPRRIDDRGGLSSAGPRLTATVRWDAADPVLTLSLDTATAVPSAAARAVAVAPRFFAVAQAKDGGRPPEPGQTRREDEAAGGRLGGIFEEVAGRVRPSVLLLDVSTNADQLGVGFGLEPRDGQGGTGLPLKIEGLDLVAPVRNVRLVLLPQFQWEPVTDVPKPIVVPPVFPERLVSANDGGPTILGSNSVHLVPIAPDRVAEQLVERFRQNPGGEPVGALFTLPFGIRAAATLQPQQVAPTKWADLSLVRPASARFRGGYQIAVVAGPASADPTVESPSLAGAAWQTRNGVEPGTLAPNGFSVLRGSNSSEGVERDFNDEMGPGSKFSRVPVTRLDLCGYGASTFSRWFNPKAVASVSQVRFDVFVGRTAYEVVQVASILYPWAVPVVRTITFERRKEGIVFREDSGWVATGPGLYRFPDPDLNKPIAPAWVGTWFALETHPGVVRGAHDVRRIRETGRVVPHDFLGVHIELLEVRFDADFDIEGVVAGQDPGDGRVPSIDQVGFVQRLPDGYPLPPKALEEILAGEWPVGGPVDCVIEVGGSGQRMRVVRVDVAPAPPLPPGVPEFAAAARGALELPADGEWTVVRRLTAAEDAGPVDPVAGVPLVRQGRASSPGSVSPWYRFAEAADVLREASPEVEFSLLQGSDAHQVLFPRPRVKVGTTAVTSTERALLADAYARATSTGLFPKRSACFVGPGPYQLDVNPQGRFTLAPGGPVTFTNIAGGERALFDSDALAIRTRYAGPVTFTLNPTQPQAWSVAIDGVTTSMDLGPFDDLMGFRHVYRAGAGQLPRLEQPRMVYAPILDPVVSIVQFLADLLGLDQVFALEPVSGSFKFKAKLSIPLENPLDLQRYIDFGAMKVKGKLEAGFGWSKKEKWFGSIKIELGMKVLILPPVFANGKTELQLRGTEAAGQEVTIEMGWGVSVEATLVPKLLAVVAEFRYGIQVIVSTGPAGTDWQIGLMVEIVGIAKVLIVEIAIRIELLAAIGRKAGGAVEAIGQARFAAEVTICWFLTVSVEYEIEYREDLNI